VHEETDSRLREEIEKMCNIMLRKEKEGRKEGNVEIYSKEMN
jgi:hypothetical protein